MTSTVRTVRRYPVKSMLGEDVTACAVTEDGLDGDRTRAVVDAATGRVATTKNPRLWRRLLACAATDGRVRLPDGAVFDHDDPGLAAGLSQLLGREVTVQGTPEPDAVIDRSVPEEVLERGVDAEVTVAELPLGLGSSGRTFVDFAPVHLVGTATLDRVASLAGERVDVLRYRPNLVVDTADGAGFGENDWVGRCVHVGDDVELRVVLPTPRCSVPTLEHGSLGRAPGALRAATHNRRDVEGFGVLPCVGVYAQVVRGGTVAAGDPVRVT